MALVQALAIAEAAGDDGAAQALMDMLADPVPAADAELPATGLTHTLERALSAPFIVTPTYGTRCTTTLTIEYSGSCELRERRFDAAGLATGESRFAFPAAAATT